MKTCKHPKKCRRIITAGWNNVNIEINGLDQDLISWCSVCGSIEVWIDLNNKMWIKPGE